MPGVLNLMLASGGLLTAQIQALAYSDVDAASALCTVTFASSGTCSGDGQASYTWKTGGGSPAQYEIRSTITGGSPGAFTSDPSAGNWISLSSDRAWTRNRVAVGVSDVTATFEIRNASTLDVLATASLSLSAEVVS